MTIAAAIDIGSNSAHLLIADVTGDRDIDAHVDESSQLGLGLIVDRQGRMGAAARAAVSVVVEGYAERAGAAGAERVLLMGTHPLRHARDRFLLRRNLRDGTGLDLVVLSHEQEASLTLLGVTGGRPVHGSLVVMDIGGGSSEVILVESGSDHVVSAIAVGSARLSASVGHHDPPTVEDIGELARNAVDLVQAIPVGYPMRGIVSGGSGTNVSRLLGRERTSAVDRTDLDAALVMLQGRRAADIAADTGLTERRVRQLAAGISIVAALMDRFGLRTTDVSDAGLREGALLASMRHGAGWLDSLVGAVPSRR